MKVLAGFRPRRRGPFVSAKGPKTSFARRGPADALRCSANPAAAQLASLKQCSPNIWIGLCFSAHAEGEGKGNITIRRIH